MRKALLGVYVLLAIVINTAVGMSFRLKRQLASSEEENDLDNRFGGWEHRGDQPHPHHHHHHEHGWPHHHEHGWPHHHEHGWPHHHGGDSPSHTTIGRDNKVVKLTPRPATIAPTTAAPTTAAPRTLATTTPVPTGNFIQSSAAIQECIRNCPVTSEYNPVCGTNMVQYNNMGRLMCARSCGVNVGILRESRCPADAPITTTTTTRSPTRSSTTTTEMTAEIRNCIRNCPVTSEYNPVCGTNMVQYNNPGRLMCARDCGVNVGLLRPSRCPVAPAAGPATPPGAPSTTQKFIIF